MSNSPKQLGNARVSVLDLNSTGPIQALATVQLDSTGGIISGSASSTEVVVRQSTAADLQMTATPAAGSTWAVRPVQSSAADLQVTATPAAGSTFNVRALQSSAADFNAAVVQGSTVWAAQVSSVAGRVAVGDYSTTLAPSAGSSGLVVRLAAPIADSTNNAIRVFQVASSASAGSTEVVVRQSTIGDLLASVQQNSTVWQTQSKIQDSSGVSPNIVGTRPSTGAQGCAVRTVLNDLQSTAFSTLGNNSTSSTIVSSAAALRHKVFAYSITSTAQAVNTLTFASSLANMIWTIQMQALSSAMTGANLSVTPPAWLFATEASSPLVFKVTGTTGTYHVSVAYFTEA